MKTGQFIHRSSSTDQLFFPAKPGAETRRALRAAGWRWNGISWWKNTNSTDLRRAKELDLLLTPASSVVGDETVHAG